MHNNNNIKINNHNITILFIVMFIYFGLSYLSEYFFEPTFTPFSIRLAPGFGFIATLFYGVPAIAGVLLGEFFYYFLLHNLILTTSTSIALAISTAIYTYLAVYLIRRLIKFPNHLTNALDWYKLFILGGAIANLLPAIISVYFISRIEPVVQQYFLLFVTHWWLGQFLGTLLIVPVLLCLKWKSVPVWKARISLFSFIHFFLIIILITSYNYVSNHEKDKLIAQIEQKSQSINSAIKMDISNYGEDLHSIKNLFEYSPGISPEKFAIFSSKIKDRQPEIHAISYQPLIKNAERESYEEMMRSIYSENFQITERDKNGKFIRANERNEYTPITMRDIYDKTAIILGFDTSSSTFSRLAREQARKTNKVAISQAFKLASTPDGNDKSVVLYLPLTKQNLFSGYVAMSIYAVRVIQSAVENIDMEAFSLQVWDGSSTDSRLFYSKNTNSSVSNSYGLSKTGNIKYISNDWKYEIIQDPASLHRLVLAQLLIITFCALIMGTVSIRIFEFTGKKYELSRRALENEARFKSAFSNAPIGMVIVSLEHIILDANPSFCKMLGYSKDEVEGKKFEDITYYDDIESNIQYHNKLISKTIDHYSIESRYLHQDGHIVWALLNVSLICDDEGNPLYGVAQIHDITEQKEHAHKLNYLASYDSLTDLINRREFERRAEKLLKRIQLENEGEYALCFMDLDQFKVVNDSCGHIAGDELIRQLSDLLKNVVRQRDTLARLGGDEFGLLMEHCSLEDSYRVASTILKAIQDYQFSWKGQIFKIGMSIGLVPITSETKIYTELLKQADTACYMAKDLGRNRIHIYHADDSEIVQRQGEIQWVSRINQAIEENRFCLYAQPIKSLGNDHHEHYELLIRLIDENQETIPPGAFLSAAERFNLIEKIDSWVINNALNILEANQSFLNKIDFVSINLSGQSITKKEFLEFIITKLESSDINGEKICFEITETAAISNLSIAMKFISTLKEKNCRFALDDFGSGLSSFAYLKSLSVDFLKIDGMFVKDIVDDPIDHAMVKSINEIGQVMGMQTIAEFVENDMIKGMLKEIGVNHVQGYGIGKPMNFEELVIQQSRYKSKS